MYLGLCSAIGYLTDAVWKSVYRVLALSATRQDVTNHGLLELGTLITLRLFGFLLDASTEMFARVMPIIVGHNMIIKWTVRAVRPLLLSADRLTRVRASVLLLL